MSWGDKGGRRMEDIAGRVTNTKREKNVVRFGETGGTHRGRD
jgi:hypothetical protein